MAEGFLSPPATTAMHSDGGPRHPVAASTSNDEKTPSPLRSGRASRLNPKGNRRGDCPDHSSGSREGDEENRGSSHDVSPVPLEKWWKIHLFRGMINDVRRRAPYYWSDWRDAWDYRVVPATVYMYFAK